MGGAMTAGELILALAELDPQLEVDLELEDGDVLPGKPIKVIVTKAAHKTYATIRINQSWDDMADQFNWDGRYRAAP